VSGATIVSAEEVVEIILANPKLIVIDSRKRTEYINGHIEGAVNILNTEMTAEDLESIAPDENTALLFYCNGVKCIRSSDAVNKAIDWGYTNLYWFRNGWKAWKEKKLPMVID
jgi:rhodanese-related sulfurtransferase